MAGRRSGLPRPAAIVEKMSGAPGQCRRIFPPQRPGAFVLPRPFAPGGKEEMYRMHKFHYDPAQLRRLHTVCFSLEGAAVEESAFRAPDGGIFILRRINGIETAFYHATPEQYAAWMRFRDEHPCRLWPG